ncbi:MAG: hypothetical protein HC876_06020 [Chloroflexaceae bacterium]|nr:hypothetical protein [Chloroflexaceae bacterium]NJO05100.1 hypothetical protein [Chloroflexaceae bacterium]
MSTYEIIAASTIDATPQQVWAVLDHFEGWTNWMPSMQNVRVVLVSDGPPREGYHFQMQGGLVRADLEVTGYRPLERVTRFVVHVPLLPPIEGQNRCTMQPLSNGRYRIERVDHIIITNKLVLKFLDATQRTRFERLAAEFIRALKQTTLQRAAYAAV